VVLLANRYVFHPFWQHHNGASGYADWADRLERSRTAIGAALRDHDTAKILSILFDRLFISLAMSWPSPIQGMRNGVSCGCGISPARQAPSRCARPSAVTRN
jgi:hypothetical protein